MRFYVWISTMLVAFGLFCTPALPQVFQPFGVDAENLDVTTCRHDFGCPRIDMAKQAGAQWMRAFAIWRFLEPQKDVFDWGELPWQIWYAQQNGIQVHLTATWAPQWANGAISTCPPYAGANMWDRGTTTGSDCAYGYRDVGRTVTDRNYTQVFFYNLARQFDGSDVSGCPASVYNASTCHPLVEYFGVWNEPNGLNNYNDTYFSPNNLGNYLNDFVTQYLFPAHDGVKSANPSAHVVAPELGTGSGTTCGGFSNCHGWNASWLQPLMQYFKSTFDVVSIHGYHADANADTSVVETAYSLSGLPIWLTETAYGSSSSVTDLYWNLYNRSSYWGKTFYNLGGYGSCSSASSLLCSYDGMTLTQTPFFWAYQQVLAPRPW